MYSEFVEETKKEEEEEQPALAAGARGAGRQLRRRAKPSSRGAKPARPAGGAGPAGAEELAARALTIVRTICGDVGVGLDDPLMDAGLDSLMAVELRHTLESSLGVQLPATLSAFVDLPALRARTE